MPNPKPCILCGKVLSPLKKQILENFIIFIVIVIAVEALAM